MANPPFFQGTHDDLQSGYHLRNVRFVGQ